MKPTIILAIVVLASGSFASEPCTLPVAETETNTYSDDFYFAASSTQGRSGDVVGIDLSMVVERVHGERLIGVAMVAEYDAELATVVGEPLYQPEFFDYGFAPLFPSVASLDGSQGFLLAFTATRLWESAPATVPVPIGTLFFRLNGDAGTQFTVRFVDNRLGGRFGQCLINELYFHENLHRYSRRHVGGTVRIGDRTGENRDSPIVPPDAHIYEGEAVGSSVNATFALQPTIAVPGEATTVDLFITSSHEYVGYTLGGRFPVDHLHLERIEFFTTPGAVLIDNDDGRFGVYAAHTRRRMAAEGENLRAVRLHFRVLEAAWNVTEIPLVLDDLPVVGGEEGQPAIAIGYSNRIRILHSSGTAADDVPVRKEVVPIELADAVLAVRASSETARGDADFSEAADLVDAIATLRHLFHGDSILCPVAADFDSSGRLDITDPIALLGVLFLGHADVSGRPLRVPCR